MERIEPFNVQTLEAACRVLADTERGLTGAELGYLIQDCKILDISPTMTKWKRLFNALVSAQNTYQVGNHLIMFINRALNPVNYARDKEKFEWRRSELNVVLSFSGFHVREDGKTIRTDKETTLKGARERAGALRVKLEDRGAHTEVFKYCRAELLDENYFHAVLEAIKGIAQRIRDMSLLTTDGAELVNTAFSVKNPVLKINSLTTETEISEQKGFSNMLVGLFGAVRNPVAHAPKMYWVMSEQNALDVLSTTSFIHRKLDIAVKA
ncbi:TIGR02391 family protein [Vibrio alginolyticus]|uniref:TIGR02391 family protein n=1 Tax=Vibrio alginolyticus TaxID=663 RepID=UPI001BD52C9F|nr:TIGR02391 family protein [Vibrio alginolyticus]MBT0002232.1 TIGR02391 family protein [Vibrio alginolyticus]